MVAIDTVLVKVASRCNLNCDYCYVYRMGDNSWASMPSRMSTETLGILGARLVELSAAQRTAFAVVLHGGEPLLLGAPAMEDLFRSLRSALPADKYPVSVQTNGVLLSDEILTLADRYDVSFSVSLDGPQDIHDTHRFDHKGNGSHAGVLKAITMLQKHRRSRFLFSGILAVVNPQSSPDVVYRYFKDLNVPSVDFLYRDGNHSVLPVGKVHLDSVEYGSWLSEMLDIYLSDRSPTYRIRILDDLIRLVLGHGSRKEGIGLAKYGILIIDTDGSVRKNDTLKSSFENADRFSRQWSIRTDALIDVVDSEEFGVYHALQTPSAPICVDCPYVQVCGGGMVTHRWRADNEYHNPTVYCADQRMLIGRTRRRLETLINVNSAAA